MPTLSATRQTVKCRMFGRSKRDSIRIIRSNFRLKLNGSTLAGQEQPESMLEIWTKWHGMIQIAVIELILSERRTPTLGTWSQETVEPDAIGSIGSLVAFCQNKSGIKDRQSFKLFRDGLQKKYSIECQLVQESADGKKLYRNL